MLHSHTDESYEEKHDKQLVTMKGLLWMGDQERLLEDCM